MKTTTLTAALALFLNASAYAKDYRICYFSLNNKMEYIEMVRFADQLNAFSKADQIVVEETMNDKESAPATFEKLAASGKTCDGLVISGHHTGAFGGARTTEVLSINKIEGLSCKPDMKVWFSQIKSTWLQGCRTLGVGHLDDNEDADFHTQRVGAVLTQDQLEMSFADLNYAFSATLDKDNPLSLRYVRAFPFSNIFGWTKTAPGEEAHSEFSVPYHIAHVAQKMFGRYYANPVGKLDRESAVAYMNALVYLLRNEKRTKQTCDVACQAWKDQGNNKLRFAFNNADNNAFPPLALNPNPALQEAKELECKLLNTPFGPDYVATVSRILESESRLNYSFHTIWDYMKELQKEGKLAEYEQMKTMMRDSTTVRGFLQNKFSKPDLGILLKIDYYTFYRDIIGEAVPKIEEAIKSMSLKTLARDAHSSQDLIDYQVTLMKLVVGGRIADKEFVRKAIFTPKNDEVQVAIVNSIPDEWSEELEPTFFESIFKVESPQLSLAMLQKEWSNVKTTKELMALKTRWNKFFDSNFNLLSQSALVLYQNSKTTSVTSSFAHAATNVLDWYEDLIAEGKPVPMALSKIVDKAQHGVYPSEAYAYVFVDGAHSTHSASALRHQIVDNILSKPNPDLLTLNQIILTMAKSKDRWNNRGVIFSKILKTNTGVEMMKYICASIAKTLAEINGDVENYAQLVAQINSATICEGKPREIVAGIVKQ